MIECKGIKKSYKQGKNVNRVLKDINLNIGDGEMVAILGKSGSGKSTLLNIMGTLDVPDAGEILFDGVHLEKMNDGKRSKMRNTRIGFVMQDYALLNYQSVLYNIMLPLFFSGCTFSKMKKKAYEVAEQVGIEDLLQQKAINISGGERQRVAIARALIIEPKVILADEPTGALDVNTSKEITDVFRKINSAGTTIVIVTHDINVAESCDRIVSIVDGVIQV